MVRLFIGIIAFFIVGGTVGCSQRSSAPNAAVTTFAALSPTPSATPEIAKSFCEVDLPDTWDELFVQGRIPLPDSDRFVPTSVAPDGTLAFGGLSSGDWSGVAAISPQGVPIRIREFGDPANDQIIGSAFDGQWLVWSEGHSLSDWNDWDLRAWDSRDGRVVDIAAAPRVNGQTLSGPFVLPVVSSGRAAWLQVNESGQGELHLYSLDDERDQIIARGKVTPPLAFWGSSLVWAETDVPGESGHLTMVDAVTRQPMSVPEPLASVRRWGSSLVTSGAVVAWDDAGSLWIWRAGESSAQQIFKAEIGDYVEFVAVAGQLVTWGGIKNQWAADLRTGGLTKITQFGWRYANGDTLLILQPIGPQKDTPRPLSQTILVDASSLPQLPGCDS